MSLPQPPTVPHCYRHPDRETGRSCTRCGKPACSDCLVQATVGSHCLDCAKAAQPDVKTRMRFFAARQRTPVTYGIIAVNVAVFLWMVVSDTAALGNRGTQDHVDLALNRTIVHYTDEWYRIVTSGFIHFGIIHLAFNMLLLVQLGNMIERAMGHVQFALLYMASLLGGSLGVLLLDGTDVTLTGGASGAVFGLLGAAAVGLHRRGVNVFSTGIGTTLMLNLALTFGIRGISIGGHLGGLAAGAVCGWVVLAPHWKAVPKLAGYAVPLAVATICLAGSVWVINTFPVFTG